ncbi:QacE family quaternary ammonium compound efflux SMR transporter [Zymomonas mobilis subsp. mobilis ZM4 = ATCC 31821]|uniref:Guanidinium exporter n=2 Tax=Zymomonas mobilis subsp. mobilis TaxID=120045 RepID=Q5NPN9_ZYMMO|nr:MULTISPECIES: multidrug efflux SMR transporter [Zymomonas]AAV89321.1 small multidrug resistance protein [Zymomonas mobilis subsp. mobilis ZM4 = ATCC 31821]ACV75120.1 small multidrug resistance protein [Zymomonas mobilis subsp. mobilis NCIMB 11163]AEH62430.1 small multidrug resistance protein [Zymomonas mobilis subsp. mobilis ATCC 10988]AHB09908.1 cation/cationic drug transporter [Zymomonas mobilis subsp. mobilis str. CP4 = NRRL B-14023]AHJ70213.1 Quaternary ammonium compound-resistance prot
MAWLVITIAGLFEVIWAYFMKQSQGFTRIIPTIIMFVTMFTSFGLLSWSMKFLPLGSAYAVWTGIGIIGSFIVGIVFLKEPANFIRILAVSLIIAGIILMKLSNKNV